MTTKCSVPLCATFADVRKFRLGSLELALCAAHRESLRMAPSYAAWAVGAALGRALPTVSSIVGWLRTGSTEDLGAVLERAGQYVARRARRRRRRRRTKQEVLDAA